MSPAAAVLAIPRDGAACSNAVPTAALGDATALMSAPGADKGLRNGGGVAGAGRAVLKGVSPCHPVPSTRASASNTTPGGW
jgi:hypothetical protein